MKSKEKIKIIGEQKVQPHSDETEVAILATLMRYNDKFSEYSDMLNAEMFYQEVHQSIFQCIAGVIEQKKNADIKALVDYANTHELVFKLNEFDFLNIVKFTSVETLEQEVWE